MFGLTIIKKKEYEDLKNKLDGLSSLEQTLEKEEKYIGFISDQIFEKKYNQLIINERTELINKINEVNRESDFIKLTILELLEVLQQSEIVQKDKRLIKVFIEVIKNVKKRLNIIKEDGDIRKK